MICCTHRKRDPEPSAEMGVGQWLRAAFSTPSACGEPAVYVTKDGAKCEACATKWIDSMISDKTMGGMLLRSQCERDGKPLPTRGELRARMLRRIQ